MTTRQATWADIDSVVRMGERFMRETTYASFIRPDAARLRATIEGFIEDDTRLLLVADTGREVVGMVAMLMYSHPFSNDRIAAEVCWWVDPEHRRHGVRLLREAERWARAQGAAAMHMVAPSERVGHFYERLGYTLVESSYQRTLQRGTT